MGKNTSTNQIQSIPPVVTVLGHVDHGKTSLLDAIRKSSVADREFGGITQKIGASSVVVDHEGSTRAITFLDTPGHETFAKMRSRGAHVADIGLLIVSSTDGVMPQTRESITLLKEAQIPYIVVLTKSDLPNKNVEKTKQMLLAENIQMEGYGGDIPVIEVSSKSGHNIKELLDLILLMYDLKPHPLTLREEKLEAIIIESRLDSKVGPRASVVVKKGTLKPREEVVSETASGKVRNLTDEHGKNVTEVSAGQAAEILGFTEVPSVGAYVYHKGEQPQAEAKVDDEFSLKRELVYQHEKTSHLAIVLVADAQGSLEAISSALAKDVRIIAKKTGQVTEADILMAKSTGAIVLGFNTPIKPDIARLALQEKVLAKNYQIIYEMLDEIADVVEGKKQALLEQVFGVAQILASFPFEKTKVLGVKVLEGRIARGDKVRIERGDSTIGEATVASLRTGKDSVSKVEVGNEAGITINPLLDFQVGDMLIFHG